VLRHVAAFEFRYQLKSPVFWVGCLLFFALTYGSVVVDTIQIGSRGNVNVNSPYAILQTLVTMGLFATFIVVAMVANVILRDDETGFAPILRATRLSRGDYLLGRFTGAVAAALLVFAVVPLAIWVGSLMPWLDPEKVGPFRPLDYLYAVFLYALPTLLILSSLFFSIATLTRSMMWTYVAAIALLVLYFAMLGLLSDPRHDALTGLLDPFGLATLQLATKYYTAAERNTLLPPLGGVLLANRLLWLGLGLALYAAVHALFRFERGAASAGRRREREARRLAKAAQETPPPVLAGPRPSPRDDRGTRLRQLWALARQDAAFVFRSPAFFVLLGIGLLNGGASMWFAGELYGVGSYPVTHLLVEALLGAYTIIPIIVAIYYAGELVWRDRDRRTHEIVDATAAPDWAHLVPKIAAIVLVLFAVALVGMLGGLLIQLLKGYLNFELGHWFLWFVLPVTIAAVHLAVLSVLVQVLVPQKYLGWGVMLVYVVAQIALSSAGFEHNLYSYGSTPAVPLSDMNGMGRFWIGRAWFQLYWSAVATILAVAAYALWRRGTTTALRPRLAAARWRLRGVALGVLLLATGTAVASGAWIWWNTNVLNAYVPAPEAERRLAQMEKDLLRFETVPQPKIVDVEVDVQLYPREARAVTDGRYLLENRTDAPLDAVHLRWNPPTRLDRVQLDGAVLAQQWPQHRYAIYRLQRPMQPGERRVLGFRTTLEERGFPNGRPLTRIVGNGTFVNSDELGVSIGMTRDGLLKDRAKRRKYDLPPDLRPPKLEDESARAWRALARDSDWVPLAVTVTTDADQTPVAPGYVVADTVNDGRRTVRFRTDTPVNNFYSVQSARYEIAKDRWRDVELAVYHHPGHEANVPRMMAAMKASLELFATHFSPYQFRQARILEFPGYEDFAQSFANTIPYSESIGFIVKAADPDQIDMVTYVTAHEIAHQWWGHQVVPAQQQGATMLIESFAQYSALLVMEQIYGRDQVRRFLKYELDRYLRRRGGEAVEELPLARVENQQYIHYQKGTLAMYWAREALGREVVDRALRRLLQRYAFRSAPYPNPVDFLQLLREEAGPGHDALIADLFEKITLLDAKATDPKATKRADGRWDVTFAVEAKKFYADGTGRETEAPLDEAFDVGVFTAKPGDRGFDAKSVLAMERRTIRTGRQTVTLTVDREPTWVGVDPYNKRIDRNSDDNLVAVGGG
jgi:aminopeptidase N